MITSIRKLVANIYVALTLCSLLLWFSYEQVQATPSSFSGNRYSGKAYFQAIFFAEGELAKKLPEIRDFNVRNFTNDPKVIQEARNFHKRVVSSIDQKHPLFFTKFGKVMNSKNHKLISHQLALGGHYLEEATLSITNLKRDVQMEAKMVKEIMKGLPLERATPAEIQRAAQAHIDNFANPQGPQKSFVAGPVAIAVAAVAFIAVAAVVASVVFGDGRPEFTSNTYHSSNSNSSKTPTLFQEQLVHSIVKL